MADATQFDHDKLSHLLADRLLEVPKFQRSYAWEASHVEEFLSDLRAAREKNAPYFMGTVVFARSKDHPERQQIVDGQQRLATTAVLLIALRDLLKEYSKQQQANHLEKTYLRGYNLTTEEHVDRLLLNPADQPAYDALINQTPPPDSASPLMICHSACLKHLKELAPAPEDYRRLVEIAQQLETSVQVLVAVASDLSEAYVIFETLNDRGADLTIADLLKNYLFSEAKGFFSYIETTWMTIANSFDKSEEFVRFIRFEHASRHGRIATRKLYKAVQADIGSGAESAKQYVQRLSAALSTYVALRDPDHSKWNALSFDVRDSLLAYRRFGFESSIPVLLAAFAQWEANNAAKLLIKLVGWSVRAQFVGRIGASLAEEAFGDAAKAITLGQAKTQPAVRERLNKLVPSDGEFKQAFKQAGSVTVARAKYLLAMLERAYLASLNQSTEGLPDWTSKTATIEHILAKSKHGSDAGLSLLVDELGNLTLLEKSYNKGLEDKPFEEKTDIYKMSKFNLTALIGEYGQWTKAQFDERTEFLAGLACRAWEG
ncbi:DUF262 domain-containing protein [Cystobacter fuscus]|uniref:DUF262 domain-containing protein n=1 Tax=Cystobacter fuscus TaxID=43 RepID=UPI002B284D46|nr:DUF262 domain-containing protein [Cystobacter fuscus]